LIRGGVQHLAIRINIGDYCGLLRLLAGIKLFPNIRKLDVLVPSRFDGVHFLRSNDDLRHLEQLINGEATELVEPIVDVEL